MCHVVCRLVLDNKTAKEFKEKIEDEYRVNMQVNYLLEETVIFLTFGLYSSNYSS